MGDQDPASPAAKPDDAAESSLHGLFEDVPPDAAAAPVIPPPIPAMAPPLPPAPTYDAAAPWPKFIPDLARSLLILRGEVEPPALLRPHVEQLLSTLSDEFRGVLSDPGAELSAGYELLARAAAIRWRVTAALSTRAAAKSADSAAVEVLFNELDLILTELRSANTLPETELHAPLESERVALAKAAVDLAEAVQVTSQAVAQEAVASSAQKYRAVPGARMLSNSGTEKEELPQRQKLLYLAFGVLVLIAALFHGSRMLGSNGPQETLPNLPAGTTGGGVVGGPTMVSTRNGEPLSPAAIEQLKAEAAKSGGRVQVLGPESVMVLPASMAGPSSEGEAKP